LTLSSSLFHEPWWLAAVTRGLYDEVIVRRGDQIVGRLPFTATRQMGFRISRMPALTHVLGPAIDVGNGKPQTKILRRLSITRSLIDQLPRFDFFKQALDPTICDGLAFQDRGFQVIPQYTFQIDCRNNLQNLWDSMHFKTRQHIRRADEKYGVGTEDNPQKFLDFYLTNLKKSGRHNEIDFSHFAMLFAECRARDCGEILAACLANGAPVAMTFVVWGQGTMYYLLSTRAPDLQDNGSVNLLIWSAMKRAHQRQLLFDLDGVSTSGTARFLAGFGGRIRTRLIVQRAQPIYRAVRYVHFSFTDRQASDTSNFT
jgi:lipid II:glycine glycyltransferase (peptidoglycan interpeptide bridge formation enzyme)